MGVGRGSPGGDPPGEGGGRIGPNYVFPKVKDMGPFSASRE